MRMRLPSGARLCRDAWLLIGASGILSVGFHGMHNLLRVLYVLRLGHGPEYVGIFGAAGALAFMAMGIPSGALGQRLGTRNTMLLGTLLIVVGMIAMPLVEFLPASLHAVWPIITQVVTTAGWSMAVVNVIPGLMAVASPGRSSDAYALNSAVRCLGTFLGYIVGGLLPGLCAGLFGQTLDSPAPYRYSLWVGAALSMAALVPVILLRLRGRRSAATHADAPDPFPATRLAVLAVYILLVNGGWATLQAFGNAYMDTDLRMSASAIGLITGAAQLVAAGGALLTPRVAHRVGHGPTLLASGLLMGLSLLPVALVAHWSVAAVGRIGSQGLEGLWLPALQAFQMERVAERWRSVAYGILNTIMGLAFAAVSLVGGYIATAAGYRALFVVGVGLTLAGSALMGGIVRAERAARRRLEPAPGGTGTE